VRGVQIEGLKMGGCAICTGYVNLLRLCCFPFPLTLVLSFLFQRDGQLLETFGAQVLFSFVCICLTHALLIIAKMLLRLWGTKSSLKLNFMPYVMNLSSRLFFFQVNCDDMLLQLRECERPIGVRHSPQSRNFSINSAARTKKWFKMLKNPSRWYWMRDLIQRKRKLKIFDRVLLLSHLNSHLFNTLREKLENF
jgi:hypothetical protein